MKKWKFIFKNASEWQTKQLSALVRRVLKSLPHRLSPTTVTVNVLPCRGSLWCTARPGIHSSFDLKLTNGGFDKKLLCCYIGWCLATVSGLKKRDLSGSGYYDPNIMVVGPDGLTTGQLKYQQLYAWADAMPLDPKPSGPPKLSGAGLAFKKAEEAQEKVNEWERKVKKATTIYKKWQRRLRYYERRAEKLQIEWAKSVQTGENP